MIQMSDARKSTALGRHVLHSLSFLAERSMVIAANVHICFPLQVQDLEFAQIEVKVLEGLKVGNDCLKKMHEVTRAHVKTCFCACFLARGLHAC